jgi:hypothetical protein
MVLTTHHKKLPVIKCCMRPWTWMDSFEQPKLRKMDMRFGTWDIRSLCRAGLFITVARDVAE